MAGFRMLAGWTDRIEIAQNVLPFGVIDGGVREWPTFKFEWPNSAPTRARARANSPVGLERDEFR